MGVRSVKARLGGARETEVFEAESTLNLLDRTEMEEEARRDWEGRFSQVRRPAILGFAGRRRVRERGSRGTFARPPGQLRGPRFDRHGAH